MTYLAESWHLRSSASRAETAKWFHVLSEDALSGDAAVPDETVAVVAYRAVVARLLSDPAVVKLGFGVGEDLRRLEGSYPDLWAQVRGRGGLQAVTDLRSSGGGSLASRVAQSVPGGLRMDKRMQTSDWGARPLDGEQLEYAALDARCLLAIHGAEQASF